MTAGPRILAEAIHRSLTSRTQAAAYSTRVKPQMKNVIPRDEYTQLLYEQAAREQRELAARVRAARDNEARAADFERCAALLEQLARPTSPPLRALAQPSHEIKTKLKPGGVRAGPRGEM